MVAVEILDCILIFAIGRFVWRLEDLCSRGLRARVMTIDVIDKNRKRLRPIAELCRRALCSGLPNLDHGAACTHLRALRSIAISVKLRAAKHPNQPIDRLGQIQVDDVRKEIVGRDGAVLQRHLRIVPRQKKGLCAVDAFRQVMGLQFAVGLWSMLSVDARRELAANWYARKHCLRRRRFPHAGYGGEPAPRAEWRKAAFRGVVRPREKDLGRKALGMDRLAASGGAGSGSLGWARAGYNELTYSPSGDSAKF